MKKNNILIINNNNKIMIIIINKYNLIILCVLRTLNDAMGQRKKVNYRGLHTPNHIAGGLDLVIKTTL